MGFALSDSTPKGLTSEKCFIIESRGNGMKDSPLNIGTTGGDVDDTDQTLAIRCEHLNKICDLDDKLAGGNEDHGAGGLIVGTGGCRSLSVSCVLTLQNLQL